ncbi:IS1182 family transposase [Aureivirga sp. CE67]|uniref:IS1182 family transposase n=1 Tax=Aureivirga sp. CE67 TaxID=1788983 RepID=UPI0018C92925|nr:IS1182 family transposase [Aureivirga sp. CE67]
MDFQKGIDRHQLQMFDLNSMVCSDSWARIVDLFVEILPLSELGFQDILAKEGRPPFHSSDLLKLYIYGYKKGIRSSRKLEEACKINIEVMWLLNGLRPSARTIAYFRKNNAEAFAKTFRFFVSLLKDWDLIKGETIAIDSFKIRAQNSLKNNFNEKKIKRHFEYIDQKINEYQEALDKADSELIKEEISSKIEIQKKRKEKYQAIEKQLIKSGESQISLIDSDARSVVLHRNIVNVGYCVQAGCDAEYKLFVNNSTGTVNDTHALSPMALDAKKLLEVKKMNVIADKGYTTGKHIAICDENQIQTFCSPKEHSSAKNGLFDMQIFEYNSEKDCYTCPNNQILKTNGTVYKKGNHKVKHYKNRQACKECPIREKCTTAKNGRYIERSIYQEALENNEKRVKQNPEYYRQRQQVTEHQFGTLKRQWGFTFTLMRGKENVLSEVNLMMVCYNLLRLKQIFDIEDLKNRLKNLVSYFLEQIILVLSRFKIYYSSMYFTIV